MAHNIHFLERIERLNYGQADRVLALYRDPEAVKFLLGKLDLGGAERVALALSDARQPPHVVLSRDGGFITCLAAGMTLGDLPAVSFDRSERVLGQFDALRDALDGRVTHGAAINRLKELFHRADGVSREQFESLRPLRALLGYELLVLSLQIYNDCEDFRRSYRPGTYRDPSTENRLLSQYWRGLWASNHLTLLLVQDIPDLERIMGDMVHLAPHIPGMNIQNATPERFTFALTWRFARSGVLGLMLRGFYIAGRLGRLALAAIRPEVDNTNTLFSLAHNAGGLAAVGLRHARFHEEVDRQLARIVRSCEERRDGTRPPPDNLVGLNREYIQHHYARMAAIAGMFQTNFQHADTASEVFDGLSRRFLGRLFAKLPHQDHPAAAFASEEDLPADVAFSYMALIGHTYPGEHSELSVTGLITTGFLPRAARADAADLYMPDTWLDPLLEPNNRVDIDLVRTHLAKLKLGPKPITPVKVEKKPGRNEPCSCGSGKKYKVCCGA